MPWRTIGQEPARRFLTSSLAAGRVVHAYLFIGPPSAGKTTLALDFARALICTGTDRPCDHCPECRLLLGSGHPDVEQVEGEDEALDFSALWKSGNVERSRRVLRIERVRELIHVMATRPSQATFRVATLDGGAVQDTAASALLKLFEEPPSRSVLILRATSVEALPPPIASRCQVVRLTTVPTAAISDWLVRDASLEPDAATAYAVLSGGLPGLAKRLSQTSEARTALDAQAALWITMLQADTVTRFDQAAVWGRNYSTARAALDLAGLVWQALLRQAAGDSLAPGHAPIVSALTQPAAQAALAGGVAAIGAQLAAIARASRLLDANTQPRLTLEWLLLEIGGSGMGR